MLYGMTCWSIKYSHVQKMRMLRWMSDINGEQATGKRLRCFVHMKKRCTDALVRRCERLAMDGFRRGRVIVPRFQIMESYEYLNMIWKEKQAKEERHEQILSETSPNGISQICPEFVESNSSIHFCASTINNKKDHSVYR
ncbi:hypothetical protein H5410_045824 [Solanum commersonii]|uniref:Uncharacterized protein n=1 Tax=Solanum commersonii TaxID=4109 RepID=A0A9J5XDV7_SOLCO|nr:hypothetical protein H5410_045824 [Solanum commersonii]